MDMKLEVVVLPVTDVDRAKAFYVDRLGFRLDADFPVDDGYRVVQVTPPGSGCSIIFGTGVAAAAPGSTHGLHLIVADIERAVAELAGRGVAVDGPFRDATGVFHHPDAAHRVPGADPQRRSYGSFAAFTDPDGNGWYLQEVTQRAPGR
ncbi:VOC family protein [Nocardia thailandica]|uniref:VOC family protein n=1 Tax=Nocardia thailandica TaxID=257275 RepID=UPI0003143183|nr:VOC family protein [Nocardia thailandica]